MMRKHHWTLFISTFKRRLKKSYKISLFIEYRKIDIEDKIYKYIKNWPSNKHQRLLINSAASEWAPVTSDVPQGFVLGPMLFIVYISDIDAGLNNLVSKFADDTKSGNSVLSNEDKQSVQNYLCKVFSF